MHCFRLLLVFDIYISQGSVATHSRCGGIFSDCFIASFLLSLMVKEFSKSVNIWRSYGQEYSFSFLTHSVLFSVYCILDPSAAAVSH